MRKQIWASISSSSSSSFGGNNESASNGNQELLLCEKSQIHLQINALSMKKSASLVKFGMCKGAACLHMRKFSEVLLYYV
jgi:hypothetical protein